MADPMSTPGEGRRIEPSAEDLLAWLRARPGTSWRSTISDVAVAIVEIRSIHNAGASVTEPASDAGQCRTGGSRCHNRRNQVMIVALYLVAVVAANLIVTALGPSSTVAVAFVLIGLNITARDRLHDAWSGRGLRWKMALLIAVGGGLSWLVNHGAAKIAIASSVAFAASETADSLVYQALHRRPWYQRANGSNAVSAAVDSLIFPTLAFGGFLPLIVLGQFFAKTCGGAIWSWVLKPRRIAVAALLLLSAPLHAQSLGLGLGEYRTATFRQNVVEAVVLAPSVVGFTPNVIASWDIDGGRRPVLIPQVGRDLLVRFPVIIGTDVGVVAGPWDDYDHWEPSVSTRLLAFIAGNLKAAVIASWQPKNGWARGVVVKLDYTLWRR